MFDKKKFDDMPKFTDMKYQYMFDFSNQAWAVYEEGGKIASISHEDPMKFRESSGIIQTDMDILADFQTFMKRPEYQILHIELPSDLKNLCDVYELLFVGAIFIRARNHNPGCNPDEAWPQIEKALNWLRITDFYVAPASSKYHDCYAGGLCSHSIKVAKAAVDLMKSDKFNDPSKLGDVVFCSLVHDWCKIDLYRPYMRNVKDQNTGAWTQVQAYEYTGSAVINLGHGVSSMFLASKFFRLTLEEASAIRWHMGAYRTSDADFDELQHCNEKFMMVHLLQFADQLSLVKF